MKVIFLLVLFLTLKMVSPSDENGELITNCQWYNRYDFDIGIVFSCNKTQNAGKNDENYFDDSDGIECSHSEKSIQRYCNKHMIDAIRFNGCQLQQIPNDTFKSYPYLRVLDISNIGLASLQPEHLIGIKRPWELLASNNQLEEIPAFSFRNAGSVVRADLSFNKIKWIDAQCFVGANELTIINLSGNKIETLNESAFRGLVNLTHMYLAYNDITEIHSFAFDGLKRLYHLDLSHNFISILEDRTFANLSKLNRLQMSYNEINEIKPYAFVTAHSLSRLDLSHNNITDEQIFDNLYNLLHLDVSHNPINELVRPFFHCDIT